MVQERDYAMEEKQRGTNLPPCKVKGMFTCPKVKLANVFMTAGYPKTLISLFKNSIQGAVSLLLLLLRP